MLEDSRPELPTPLWFVVLVGIGVVVSCSRSGIGKPDPT
jgi:hypothetical protein